LSLNTVKRKKKGKIERKKEKQNRKKQRNEVNVRKTDIREKEGERGREIEKNIVL